jgi:hypothetical protein
VCLPENGGAGEKQSHGNHGSASHLRFLLA